jgi:hypothetical protein
MAVRLLAVLVLLACAAPAAADPVPPQVRRGLAVGEGPQLFLDVPLDYDTSVVYPFGGSHRNTPGTVTINRPAYWCAPDRLGFGDRAAFVAHLRVRHGVADEELPHATLVQPGQLRYLGR